MIYVRLIFKLASLTRSQEKRLIRHIKKWSRDIGDNIISTNEATFVYTNEGMFKFINNNQIYHGVERIAQLVNEWDSYKNANSKVWHQAKDMNGEHCHKLCWCIRSYFRYDHTHKVSISEFPTKFGLHYKLTFQLVDRLTRVDEDTGGIKFKIDDALLWDRHTNIWNLRMVEEDKIFSFLDSHLLTRFKALYPYEIEVVST